MKNTISIKNIEFKKIYKKGKSVANNLLILYTLESDDNTVRRLGICSSKKIGNSVIRHRSTRLIRESYRHMESNIKQGYYVVVIARKNIIGKKCMEVESALNHLLRKADLLIKND